MSDAPLAIFGGTFDPVHFGHLRVAWEAAEALGAEVRMMPAHVPPHRAAPVADAATRVALLRRALEGQSKLVLDTRELDRAGASFTFDTLTELRAEVGAARPLALLLGADAFAGFERWHRWRAILDLAHLVVMTRPGAARAPDGALTEVAEARRADDPASLRDTPAGRIVMLSVTPLEISASAIRRALAAGREPRFLMPAACLADAALLAPYRTRET